MKILVIHGSMRKGNTYKLTQAVIEKLMLNKDVHLKEISVSELNLPFCMSCHVCFEKGEERCPHRNIVGGIAEEIETSDALIVSGVVYSMHLNAAMKNLIDHLSYYFHRPKLFDKKALVVTTTAGAGEKTVAKYLASIMGHWGAGYIKSISCKIRTVPFSLTEKQQSAVNKVSDEFYNAISHNSFTAPTFGSVAVHNSFRGMSSGSVVVSECDRDYWQQTGMKDKVYPRRVSVVKAAVGSVTAKVLKKVISKTVKIDK